MTGASSRFTRFSAWISVLTFLLVEGYVFSDQWELGQASALYMLGTALLVAGACIGLFALLAAVELLIASVLRRPLRRL
jgi:hypothetical protein